MQTAVTDRLSYSDAMVFRSGDNAFPTHFGWLINGHKVAGLSVVQHALRIQGRLWGTGPWGREIGLYVKASIGSTPTDNKMILNE